MTVDIDTIEVALADGSGSGADSPDELAWNRPLGIGGQKRPIWNRPLGIGGQKRPSLGGELGKGRRRTASSAFALA